MDPYWLFKAPAIVLIIGLLGIDRFISNTHYNIAQEKKAKAAADAAKKRA